MRHYQSAHSDDEEKCGPRFRITLRYYSTPPILISFLSLQYPKWILIDGIGDDIGLKLHEMYTHTQQSITSETFFCFLSSVPGQTVTPPPPSLK